MSGGINVLSPLPAGHFLQEQATDNYTTSSGTLTHVSIDSRSSLYDNVSINLYEKAGGKVVYRRIIRIVVDLLLNFGILPFWHVSFILLTDLFCLALTYGSHLS